MRVGVMGYDYGFRIYNPGIARFLSVDPLESEYPWSTPYAFAADSPILYMDGDGREVIINLATGRSLVYKPGMTPPKDDEFAQKVIASLNMIHSSKEGALVVNSLVDSKRTYNVNASDRLFAGDSGSGSSTASFSLGANGELDQTFKSSVESRNFNEAQSLIENITDLSIGAFNGNIERQWKVNGIDPDRVKMNFTLMLGHEVYHAYQFELGAITGAFLGGYVGEENSVPFVEMQAVGFENYLRGELFQGTEFEKTRGTYNFDRIDGYWKDGLLSNLVGGGQIPSSEFGKPGSNAYVLWKISLTIKSIEKGDELLDESAER